VFNIYLSLPAGLKPTDAAAAQYRVGMLNFFDAIEMSGMSMGRDYIFDLTALTRQLDSANRLAAGAAITIAPSGPPQPGSIPAIRGSVEVIGQ